MTKDNHFKNRISESSIAKILNLIERVPNKHEERRVTDKVGSYDFWFDGGACIIQTGSSVYHFDDGTTALAAAAVPWVSIIIEFPNGERVKVEQENQKK